MELHIGKTFAWTDSTIVLSWLNREANTRSTFDANRIAETQDSADLKWNHVPSPEIPVEDLFISGSRSIQFKTVGFMMEGA